MLDDERHKCIASLVVKSTSTESSFSAPVETKRIVFLLLNSIGYSAIPNNTSKSTKSQVSHVASQANHIRSSIAFRLRTLYQILGLSISAIQLQKKERFSFVHAVVTIQTDVEIRYQIWLLIHSIPSQLIQPILLVSIPRLLQPE